ncbi:luc7-like protein 3 isoform X1 [Hyla sarda]|uniref:luc7-like protein 3 isoform X1 n=1 Tax=Hyla sarda TaxID=327740 RepID=UPI0024C2645A|nr:luc7-like protein 3 isoform X1 [Hyla sarda]XP_056406104.1 luc7-like protein 3 isoform X1 [Hyla sarda]XP_056406105.1 luc7-like protein 3 isoform X1 [Hyla sarda]
MLSAAQLLDELMGRDRNLAPDEKRCNVRWDDESVCKHFLCEFCPAELFTNTRSDLGPCEKIHDENLRKQYEKSSRYMKVGYEREFLRYLQSLLAEVERRIRRGHARLALSQNQQASGSVGPAGKNEEKIQVLTDKIEGLLLQIEELGSEGKVEEAQGMMKLVEQLKEERELLKSTTSTIESFAAQEKQMEVCEVCGAFLIVGDAQSRVDDHLMGKQHMGYAKIKNTVEELKEKLRKKTDEPEDRPKKEKDDKDQDKEKDREKEEKDKKRRREGEEREKDKNRDRDKRKRSRSRSRNSSRASERRSSRSRDHKRSRSRERRRSRSRERQRSRSHNRTDRKHRSRSRDKRRSKSRERKSYKHRSRSRDRERRSKEREKRSDDKKSSKSSSRDGQSESRKSDSKDLSAQTSVNGANEGVKSEGDTQSN